MPDRSREIPRREFLINTAAAAGLLGLGTLSPGLWAGENAKPDRPNVLWILCDELRKDALGCYGNRHFKPQTPHFDSIAASGVRFDNCFCSSPVCVPSRVAMLTAQYPEQTGVYHNEGANLALEPNPLTFPEIFTKNGYDVANFGKTHVARSMRPFKLNETRGGEPNELKVFAEQLQDTVVPPGDKTPVYGRFPADKRYPPSAVTENALRWLSKTKTPFFLRVSYLQPHTPVFTPPPFDTQYEMAAFPDRFDLGGHRSHFEQAFAEVCKGAQWSPKNIQRAQQCYYGLVAWIDAQVGQLLDALKRSDRLKNTLILVDADHGASLGEGGCHGKHIFAPQSHRTPRLMAWAEHLKAGEIRDDICEGLDVARTALELAGLEVPPHFKGRNLFNSQAPEAVYSTIGFGLPGSCAFPFGNIGHFEGSGWPRRACVRTARYRLDRSTRRNGRYLSGAETDVFLADTTTDPEEKENLANKPEHREIQTHLETLLDNHVAKCVEHDPSGGQKKPNHAGAKTN